MKQTITHLMALLVLVSMLAITLTACGSPTVDLNDYVEITVDGYNGYGSIHASLNYSKLIEDHADRLTDKLDSQYFGDQTPSLAASMIFASYKPYALAYESPDDLQNGDTVSFTWNTSASAIEKLSAVLDVKISYENFDYTVKGLEALREVDPFENVPLDTWGISGKGCVSDYLKAKVQVADDYTLSLDLSYDNSKQDTYSNGDSLHVALANPDPVAYAQQYGVVWSRTEADIELNEFSYYAQENPREILDCLSENGESLTNALTAVTEFVSVDTEERQFELAGVLYYYENEGSTVNHLWNKHNQLVLIYHVTNGKVPGGWYTYMAPNNDVIIGYEEDENGVKSKVTITDAQNPLQDLEYYYSKEIYHGDSIWFSYAHPITFTYDGSRYVGHQTIEDCIAAYEANELSANKRAYDHLIVSDSLQGLVTER